MSTEQKTMDKIQKSNQYIAEYIITFHENVDTKYSVYLLKRIKESGLTVQLVSHDKPKLDFLKIYTSKEWLIHFLSTESNLEEYLAINVNTNKDSESIEKEIESFRKLPKQAILPSSLNSHIIQTTLQNITIDDELIDMLNKDNNIKRSKHANHLHLVPMDRLITIYKNFEIIQDIFPMSDIKDINIDLDKNKMKIWGYFFNLSYFSQMDQTNNLNKIRDYYGEVCLFVLLCIYIDDIINNKKGDSILFWIHGPLYKVAMCSGYCWFVVLCDEI